MEEMQVREVEVKVGGSGTFGWPSRGGGRRMGEGSKVMRMLYPIILTYIV